MSGGRQGRLNPLHKRVVAPAVYFFIVMLGIILGRGARDSLLLSHPLLGVGALPWIYIGNALFGVFLASLYAAAATRLAPRPFATLTLGVFAALVLAVGLLSSLGGPGAAGASAIVAAYLLAQAVWVLSLMQVWTLCAHLFDAREAKAAYPLIGAGSLVGMIVAGFVARPIVGLIGTLGIFPLWFALHVAAFAVLRLGFADRLPAARPEGPRRAPGEGEKGFGANLALVAQSPLLKTLLVLTLLLWTVFTVLDYQFSLVARQEYTVMENGAAHVDKDGLTSFLGLFRGLCGFGALLFQFLVTPLLVRRLGVGRCIVVHPLANTGTTALMALSFGFWTASIAKGIDHVLLYTIQDSSYSLLFNAIPSEKRARARSFVEGTIRPLGTGLGGVALLFATFLLSPVQLCWLLFLLSAAWLLVALRIRVAYVQGLVSALSAERETELPGEALKGPESLAALRETIRGGDPVRSATALEMAGALGAGELRPEMLAALSSRSSELKCAAVGALGILGRREDFEAILELTRDPDAAVRTRAVEACGAIGEEMDVEHLVSLVKDPEETVRVAAVIALIRVGGLDGILAAAETLGRLLESAQVPDRAMAAKILGETRVRHFIPSLVRLLKDPNPLVRHRSVRALGKIGSDRAAGPLVECLADPHLRSAALYALSQIGKKAVPALLAAIQGASPETRRLAARALALVRKGHVEETLMDLTDDPDPVVRGAALDGLAQRLKSPVTGEKERERLLGVVRQELKFAYRNRRGESLVATHLGSDVGAEFLGEICREECDTSVRHALLALGLTARPDAILEIAARASSRDPRARALALEAVENLAAGDLSRPLAAIVDRTGADWEKHLEEMVPEDQRRVEGLLDRLSRHPSSLVRAALAYALGDQKEPYARSIRDGLRGDEDELVRESAAATMTPHDPKGGDEMLNTIEKVLFLRSCSLFRGLKREDLPHVAAIAETVEEPAGAVLFEAGAPGDAAYLIVSGRIEVIAPDGRHVAWLEPPEVVGEMAILDDNPRSAAARAATEATLLRISREDFREIIMERPEVAFGIFKTLTGRVRASLEPHHVAAGTVPA